MRRINHFGDNGYWCAWNNGVAFGTRAGRINHYALRSKDAFQLKLRRGFSNRVNYGVRGADDPMNYWRSFDWNSVENYRILRHADTANKIAAELKSDPKIAKWHHFAVALHQEQADNLERVDDGLPADTRKALADFGQRLDALAPQRDIAELEGHGLAKSAISDHV